MTLRAILTAGLLAVVVTSPRAAPDPARGEQVYARCLACHALAYDRVGPRHCGLFGRRAGSVVGFAYSPAMKRSRIVWDEATLDKFLSSPTQALPGTAMTYDGVPEAQDRRDLIAYLRAANGSAACAGPSRRQ